MLGIRPAFDNNTIVDLELTNEASRELSLVNLGSRLVVVTPTGEDTRLHELSVGIKKPIVLRPQTDSAVSLLFAGKLAGVHAIRLDGQEITLSR